MGQISGINGFGKATEVNNRVQGRENKEKRQPSDLVDLEEEGIAGLLLDRVLNSLWICDEKIVSNNLAGAR